MDKKQVAGNKRASVICGRRILRSSGFLRRIGRKVAKALQMMSGGSMRSRKVSSATLAKSSSYAETRLDSHQAEAIEDCIEFLNNSSLPRYNSVKSSC